MTEQTSKWDNKSSKLFCVVEFPKEETDEGSYPMAIISEGWIFLDDGKLFCWWPNFKTDKIRENALRSHALIGPENSTMCEIIVKYKTESLEKAKKKLKLLETTSDIETDASFSKHKRTKASSQKFKDFVLTDTDTDTDESISALPKIPLPKILISKSPELEVNVPVNEGSSEVISEASSCTTCKSSHELLTKMYRNHEKFVLEINEKLEYITGMIQQQTLGGNELEIHNLVKIPINTIEDLEFLNTLLCDENNYKQYLTVLKVVGGKDSMDTTRRVMTKLIGHNLALAMNWSGRNDKPPFQSFTIIIRLICDSVKANPLSINFTINLVERSIKAWLRGACDRQGGRTTRKKNPTE